MKKLSIIAAIAALFVAKVNAQETETPAFGFDQGNVFLEGSFSFSSYKNNNEPVTTRTGFVFTPKVGYFVTEDLAVGVQLGVSSYKEKVEVLNTSVEEKTTGLEAGVFGRYYFLDLGQRFKTYAELGVNFGGTKYDDGIDGTDDRKINGIGAGIGLGINYFVTEKMAISFGLSDILSYRTSKVDVDGAESENNFNANINVFNNFFATAQFGMLYKF